MNEEKVNEEKEKEEKINEKKEWVDVTTEFEELTKEMKDSEMIHFDNFSLLEVMSAIEVLYYLKYILVNGSKNGFIYYTRKSKRFKRKN
jgi:hypothetical protein